MHIYFFFTFTFATFNNKNNYDVDVILYMLHFAHPSWYLYQFFFNSRICRFIYDYLQKKSNEMYGFNYYTTLFFIYIYKIITHRLLNLNNENVQQNYIENILRNFVENQIV